MTVVDAIAAVPRYNAGSPFTDVPLRDFTSGTPNETHLVVVNTIRQASLFPIGAGASIIELRVENSAPAVVSPVLTGSSLTLAAVGFGSATLTVRAVDVNGNAATATFSVSVPVTAPVFTGQPAAQTVAAGSTVVFNAPAIGATSYRWQRNGLDISGATSATLVINNAATADAELTRRGR